MIIHRIIAIMLLFTFTNLHSNYYKYFYIFSQIQIHAIQKRTSGSQSKIVSKSSNSEAPALKNKTAYFPKMMNLLVQVSYLVIPQYLTAL